LAIRVGERPTPISDLRPEVDAQLPYRRARLEKFRDCDATARAADGTAEPTEQPVDNLPGLLLRSEAMDVQVRGARGGRRRRVVARAKREVAP